MELIVFDLDGTLLNTRSKVSEHTAETLRRLRERDIAYTVATGRTLHAATGLLEGHGFTLPHIYKNGVMVWCPTTARYSYSNVLTNLEVWSVVEAFLQVEVTPFIFTLEVPNRLVVFHPPLHNAGERRLAQIFGEDRGLKLRPIAELPAMADITNISALGAPDAIDSVIALVQSQEHLVAYSGAALEGEALQWIDIHHSAASKGGAIAQLKQDLGIRKVICFGDSDNDLSMFAMADESYAPSNAKPDVLAAATAIIGHHDQDGISEFLRIRFSL